MKIVSLQLPIDTLLPEIVQTIERNTLTLIEAEPGAGKTTRVPIALTQRGRDVVLVLEPRRLAARLAARRVAEESGTSLGDMVGYQVRFEKVGSDQTKLWYLTEGVLSNRLLSGRPLPRNAVVILDEFHERHLETDLALALLRDLLPRRPDLRLVLMSATLGAETLAASFGGVVPVIEVPGRTFPLVVHYHPSSSQVLEEQVATAVGRAVTETTGHVLVFLPGAAEIRKALRTCEPLARKVQAKLLPLHGDLTPEQQDAAVSPGARRKIICSTNVAESSVTLEGVTAVVDSGLARVLTHSHWSGIGRLEVSRVSRASCLQRAGRAGRTGPGVVIRLFTQEDFARRPERIPVEIIRADLAQLVLQLADAGLSRRALLWLDPPPAQAIAEARRLLRELNALDDAGFITPSGRAMSKLPAHPRLSALVLKAASLGEAREASKLAALLSEGRTRLPENARHQFTSDIEALLSSELSFHARKLQSQFQQFSRRTKFPQAPDRHALEKAVLFAFSDRVARRRGQTLLLSNGTSAQADRNSCTESEFCVIVDVDDRNDQSKPLARIASPIQPDWLLDLFPDAIEAVDELQWNRDDQRVERVQRLRYRRVIIDESTSRPAPDEEVRTMLVEKALELGQDRWTSQPEVERLLTRISFAARHAAFETSESLLRSALHQMADGLVSLKELREAEKNGTLLALLESMVDRRLLDSLAPATLTLPNGRRARIDYTPGKPPSVASRLQDFIGLSVSPAVAGGTVPLVLHLLAPNGRPVQVTNDLPSFWENLYPQVRRELSRRYPKHSWPEAPA